MNHSLMIKKIETLSKRLMKSPFKALGFGIHKLKTAPSETLLGLKDRPINAVVDVGANKGQFAKYISRFFPKAKIYSFEPLRGAYEDLEKWSKAQQGRVKCFNLALGEEKGVFKMNQHLDHSPSSSMLQTTKNLEKYYPKTIKQDLVTVDIETIDGLLERHELDLSGEILFKLDVQGYEDRVLKGARKLLDIASFCLIEINLDSLYEDQASFNDIYNLVNAFGFSYAGNLEQIHDDDGRAMYVMCLFTKNDSSRIENGGD